MDGKVSSEGRTGNTSTPVREGRVDAQLQRLIESADECQIVPGGYRLRFAGTNTTLVLAVWLDVRVPAEPRAQGPSADSTQRRVSVPVVA